MQESKPDSVRTPTFSPVAKPLLECGAPHRFPPHPRNAQGITYQPVPRNQENGDRTIKTANWPVPK